MPWLQLRAVLAELHGASAEAADEENRQHARKRSAGRDGRGNRGDVRDRHPLVLAVAVVLVERKHGLALPILERGHRVDTAVRTDFVEADAVTGLERAEINDAVVDVLLEFGAGGCELCSM